MATLMLVEEGKLSLDAKVNDVLPGMPAAWSGVTVRHLLSHTSGIKSYTEVFGAQKTSPEQVFTTDEILALVKDAPAGVRAGRALRLLQHRLLPARDDHREGSGKPYGPVPRRTDLRAARR